MDNNELNKRAEDLIMLCEDAIAGIDKFSFTPSPQDVQVIKILFEQAKEYQRINYNQRNKFKNLTKRDIQESMEARDIAWREE